MTPRTILVVEDDSELRQTVSDLLSDEGYAVSSVEHGGHALAWLAKSPSPALILLDLMMPVVDGWTFLARIRKDPALADIPVVIMSASANPPDGAERVAKPVDLQRLLEVVARRARPRS